MKNALILWYARIAGWLDTASPVLDLGIRLFVAEAFFRSGLLKIGNWSGTLYLFQNEYHVPLLPPEAAAWLGAFGELAFPPLLALGLATRFAALSMTFVNLVAVASYWHVLMKNDAALAQHVLWGTLLLVTLLHGPGKLSLDCWLKRRLSA
ncbi:MAG: DoxX family protein [Burkholderiales bacterium]